MKAFKTINLNIERKIAVSYTSLLCLVCSFIVLSPVFSQDGHRHRNHFNENHSDHYNYDEDGNIIITDSSYCFSWKNTGFHNFNYDSLFDGLSSQLKYFDEEFRQNLSQSFNFNGLPWLTDTTNLSQHGYSDFNQFLYENMGIEEFLPNEEFRDNIEQQNKEFMKKFQEYRKEHKKLIEKYFQKDNEINDSKQENKSNHFQKQKNKPAKSSKGTV